MPRPLKPLTVSELIAAQGRLIRQLDASEVNKSRAARVRNLLLEAVKELKVLEFDDTTKPF